MPINNQRNDKPFTKSTGEVKVVTPVVEKKATIVEKIRRLFSAKGNGKKT